MTKDFSPPSWIQRPFLILTKSVSHIGSIFATHSNELQTNMNNDSFRSKMAHALEPQNKLDFLKNFVRFITICEL
jgi:hypothetical protein